MVILPADASPDQLAELAAAARRLAGEARELEEDFAAGRLAASVIRPLDAAGAAAPADESLGPVGAGEWERALWERALWELTRAATALRVEHGGPAELVEATAALQDLACSLAVDETARAERVQELGALQSGLEPSIVPQRDGPYQVTNPRRLESWLGTPLPTRPQMALCRCGQSAIKPLCDGSHAAAGFSDAKDPSRVADRRDTYVGQQVTILDNRGTCQHSGFCTDRLARVFHLGEEPFVTPSGGRMDEIVRAVRDCPSGALSYAVDGVEARETVDHHGRRKQAIEVTKDGSYRVTGGVALVEADGSAIARNQGASRQHYALCRCGHSQNKPFCSGAHRYVEFRDPVPDPERTPTMFEWAGGLPALTRMTRLFYEKHVPNDPLLAPLFAEMSADHPERVAKWLGEVFGGPPCFSEEYGGYPRMLSQHTGKGLKEEWRARWVALLLESAREAGLPNDAEFRAAFQAYIEWGSRLAVENSQPGARPPQNMPMPRWDWNTGAGPPGSRMSALAAPEEAAAEPIALPGPGEPIGFEPHIRQLFREGDRRSMRGAFDLWSHEDVRGHADKILERVANGSMPCDGAWPKEWVDAFARWLKEGAPA